MPIAQTMMIRAGRPWTLRAPGGSWPVFGFAAIWILGVMLPLVGLVAFSLLRSKEVSFIYEPTLDNYIEIVTGGRLEVTGHSIRLMGTVTLIELLIAFPFALWLAKYTKSDVVRIGTLALLSVPFFLTPAARVISWRVVLGHSGLVNYALINLGITDEPLDWLIFSEFAVHLGFIGPYFPSMVFPIFLAMTMIDDEFLEASRDLGASGARTLRHIIMPLAMPGVVAGIIFTFVPMLGDTVVPQLVGGGRVWLMGAQMLDLITYLNYALAAGMATIILILMGVLQFILWLVIRKIGGLDQIFEALKR